ncbi:MAG: hypothetical protein MUE85_17625 [Microscillaceae bacterium]|jgi:hypothetical protein|nr:hypothetical protein [Microscillaceae bacterium]
MKIQHYLPWAFLAVWVAGVLYQETNAQTFSLQTPYIGFKLGLWLLFIGFTAYSYYCSTRENIFKIFKIMAGLHWGRQIGIDLYLGVALSLGLIFLHQGLWVMLLWLVPCLIYANIVTLFYFAVHFDSLVARFFVG